MPHVITLSQVLWSHFKHISIRFWANSGGSLLVSFNSARAAKPFNMFLALPQHPLRSICFPFTMPLATHSFTQSNKSILSGRGGNIMPYWRSIFILFCILLPHLSSHQPPLVLTLTSNSKSNLHFLSLSY